MPRLIHFQRTYLFYWRIYCSSNNCQSESVVKVLETGPTAKGIYQTIDFLPACVVNSFVINSSTQSWNLDQWKGNLVSSSFREGISSVWPIRTQITVFIWCMFDLQQAFRLATDIYIINCERHLPSERVKCRAPSCTPMKSFSFLTHK